MRCDGLVEILLGHQHGQFEAVLQSLILSIVRLTRMGREP